MNASRILPIVARTILGLPLVVFGAAALLGLGPQPEHTGVAAAYLGGLAAAPYFFPLLKITEIVAGLALLTGRFVPLALVVLAPVTLHIALFHLFLDPALGMVVALLGSHLVLAWWYRDSFRGVLAKDASPRVTAAPKLVEARGT